MGSTNATVEAILNLTANQIEARGTPPGDGRFDFELAHYGLASTHRDLKDTLTGMHLENGKAEIIEDLFRAAVLWAYQLGSASPNSDINKTKHKTGDATKERARKNEYWVQPFNKAVQQAHSEGHTGQDAVNAARKCLDADGVRIPVQDKALLSREHELRTGKKRRE
jgi:hypothetical protein